MAVQLTASTVFPSLPSAVFMELWQIQAMAEPYQKIHQEHKSLKVGVSNTKIYFHSKFSLGTKACVIATTNQTEIRHIYEQTRKLRK